MQRGNNEIDVLSALWGSRFGEQVEWSGNECPSTLSPPTMIAYCWSSNTHTELRFMCCIYCRRLYISIVIVVTDFLYRIVQSVHIIRHWWECQGEGDATWVLCIQSAILNVRLVVQKLTIWYCPVKRETNSPLNYTASDSLSLRWRAIQPTSASLFRR